MAAEVLVPADALREVSTAELLTAIEVLTHRIHEIDRQFAPQRLADLRAQRRLARAEILRRTGDA